MLWVNLRCINNLMTQDEMRGNEENAAEEHLLHSDGNKQSLNPEIRKKKKKKGWTEGERDERRRDRADAHWLPWRCGQMMKEETRPACVKHTTCVLLLLLFILMVTNRRERKRQTRK